MMTYGQAMAMARAQAWEAWFKRHGMDAFVGADGRWHAGPNGVVGVNGEHYEPGQWIATDPETVKGMRDEIASIAREIAMNEWLASADRNAAFRDRLFDFRETHDVDFLDSLNSQLWKKGYLSDRQVEAGIRTMDAIEEREQNKPAERDDSASEHFGRPGERVEIDVHVDRCIRIENAYNEYYYVVLMHCGDNVVVYFGSGELAYCEGEDVKIRATIKRHDERNGVRQTIINRPLVRA